MQTIQYKWNFLGIYSCKKVKSYKKSTFRIQSEQRNIFFNFLEKKRLHSFKKSL